MTTESPHDHFGPDCPQCGAMADQAQALGGLAEAMQKMLDDGFFRRLGRSAAWRREVAFWLVFAEEGPCEPDAVVEVSP